MKYGEIKIEALRLMFANNGVDIHVDDLPIYEQDENYRFYLVNMPESVNRCLSRIEERRVLPDRSRRLKRKEGVPSGAFIRFNLAAILDLYDIERVVYEDESGGYCGNAAFEREGSVIVLPYYEESDGISYTVIYKPKITRVHSYTDNEYELDLPESIASIIPYYLKGDLFRDDEPDEASEARNWFEAAFDEISAKREGTASRVKTVYSQAGW